MELLCDNGDYSHTKMGRRIRMQAGERSIETKRTVCRNRSPLYELSGRLSGPLGTTVSHLHIVELGFERFYGAVGNFQILVEAIALGNKLKGRVRRDLELR